MKNTKLFLLTALALLPGLLLAQQSLEYCNNRFGFCVQYPVDLHLAADRPVNADGIMLEAAGGEIVVNISGSHNVMDWSTEKLYAFEKEEFAATHDGEARELRLETDEEGFRAVLVGGEEVEAIRMWRLNGAYMLITIQGPISKKEAIETLWNQIKVRLNS